MTIQARYDLAVAAHGRGELGEAERLYRRLLEAAPTSVAARHMLGMLKASPAIPTRCWRWFLGRNDSPWHSSMQLFRQPKDGDWPSVFAEIESQVPR